MTVRNTLSGTALFRVQSGSAAYGPKAYLTTTRASSSSSTTPPSSLTSKDRGDQLEQRVVRLFRTMGKWNIKHNIVLKDKHGNRSQIDLVHGFGPWKTYVECKNYSSSSVPLDDVAKFKEVLVANGISMRRGMFITTSTYTPRALTTGIRTVDGVQLKELEQSARKSVRTRRWRRYIGITLAMLGAFMWGILPPREIFTAPADSRWLSLRSRMRDDEDDNKQQSGVVKIFVLAHERFPGLISALLDTREFINAAVASGVEKLRELDQMVGNSASYGQLRRTVQPEWKSPAERAESVDAPQPMNSVQEMWKAGAVLVGSTIFGMWLKLRRCKTVGRFRR